MLIEGRKRAEAAQMADSLDWVVGDAMALPFEDNTFDVYTISFGIRNVTRPQEALNEAFRVLRPGGRLMVLEFSQMPNELMQKVYDLYSFNVIPRMGQVIAGDRDSYQYLVESIRNFPDQETFLRMVQDGRVRKGQVSQPDHGHCLSAFRLENLDMRGPHNIWRLIRTGATLERTGAMGWSWTRSRRRRRCAVALRLLGWPFQWLGYRVIPAMPPAVRALTALGPAYIKFGQILSTRPDVVGDELATQLRVLQDKLPPFSVDEAKRSIAQRTGPAG